MKKVSSVVDYVYSIAEAAVKDLNLQVWNVSFEKEGRNEFLRVYLDKDGGNVAIEDCETVSRRISKKLDAVDPIDRSYFLEVSSVGSGRRLLRKEHFEKLKGKPVSIKLFKAFEGKKNFDGILRGFENSVVKIETDDEIVEVLFSNCAYVKLNDKQDFDLF